jgi:hypothetical protein
MNEKTYPKIYRDKLNRINYILQNEFQKIIYTFYGETNKIKVKYVYFRKNVYFDVFSKTGEVIFSTVEDTHSATVEKKYDGTISFTIHPVKKNLINKL